MRIEMKQEMIGMLKIAIFATVVFLPIGLAQAQNPPNLELKLLCDKSEYLLEEPIWVDILLISHEVDTVMVNFPTPKYDHFRFIVVEEGRDTVQYSGMMLEFGGHAGMLPDLRLAPGDTVYFTYNLIHGYASSPRSTRHNRIPLHGKIEITGVFWNRYYSAQLNILISKPTGVEEEVYMLYREGQSHRMRERMFDRFQEILESYPNSVYAPVACRGLAAYYNIHLHDSEKDREYSLRLLSDYPNSGYALGGIGAYIKGVEEEARVAKFDSLQTADKPFRLRMIARNIQRNLPHY